MCDAIHAVEVYWQGVQYPFLRILVTGSWDGFLQVARVMRPPMEEFLRKLLFKDLNKLTSEKVDCSEFFLSETTLI